MAGPTYQSPHAIKRRLRVVLGLFVVGLVVSGITAFPLLSELDWGVRAFGLESQARGNGALAGLAGWIVHVRDGLRATTRLTLSWRMGPIGWPSDTS